MQYPRVNNFLIYKKNRDGSYTVVDSDTNVKYEMSGRFTTALRKMDGNQPVESLFPCGGKEDGEDWQEYEDTLIEMGLLRRGRVRVDGMGGVNVALWMSRGKCSRKARKAARIIDTIVRYLWIPVFIAGLFSYACHPTFTHFYGPYGIIKEIISIVFGVLAGAILHELSHAASGIACGAYLFEAGVGLSEYFPCAYVIFGYHRLQGRMKEIHILLAGVEMQFLLVGSMLLLRGVFPAFIALFERIAFINIIIGICNLFPAGETDGLWVLCSLFNIPRIWDLDVIYRILTEKPMPKGAEGADNVFVRFAILLFLFLNIWIMFFIFAGFYSFFMFHF